MSIARPLVLIAWLLLGAGVVTWNPGFVAASCAATLIALVAMQLGCLMDPRGRVK